MSENDRDCTTRSEFGRETGACATNDNCVNPKIVGLSAGRVENLNSSEIRCGVVASAMGPPECKGPERRG